MKWLFPFGRFFTGLYQALVPEKSRGEKDLTKLALLNVAATILLYSLVVFVLYKMLAKAG